MKASRTYTRPLLALVGMALFFGFATNDRVLARARGTYSYVHLFTEVLDEVKRNYVDEKDAKDLVYAAIRGMLRELDPHSVFLDENAYGELKIDTKGSFGGLGIVISIRDQWLTVMSPIEGTPAWTVGLQAGDRIISIEGESTEGITTEQAVEQLRGPRGTQVNIGVARQGFPDVIDYTITRDVIAIKAIPYAGLVGEDRDDGSAGDVGYVRLVNFSENAGGELADAISSVLDQDVDGLILDLRNNSGGLLEQAVNVADLFVARGERIVYTQGRHENDNREWFARSEPLVTGIPLVVLVNEGTASASEIVSGAIQDYDLGIVVGTTTYGKGSVQTVRNLSSGTALKLTTAVYYPPSGRSIHRWDRTSELHMSDETTDSFEAEEGELFHTSGGREIRGGGGVNPDIEVENPEASRLLVDILRNDLFFKFAVSYTSDPERRPETESFEIGDEAFVTFRELLVESEVEFTEEELGEDRAYIEVNIRRQIASKLWGTEAMYRAGFDADYQVAHVLEFLDSIEGDATIFSAAESWNVSHETAEAPADDDSRVN